MTDQPTTNAAAPDGAKFLGYLDQLVANIRRQTGGNDGWWVVGGLARDAMVGRPQPPVKYECGNWRDVDLLFSAPLLHIGRRIRRRNTTPLDLEIVTSNIVVVHPGERAYLKAGRASVDVSPDLFERQMVSLDGVEFPTLPASTLLHMYCVGIHMHGATKKSDVAHMYALARLARLAKTGARAFPHELYEGFHHFARLKSGMEWANQLAQWYWQSPLQRIVPLNHVYLYPCLERLWLGAAFLERHIAGPAAPAERWRRRRDMKELMGTTAAQAVETPRVAQV